LEDGLGRRLWFLPEHDLVEAVEEVLVLKEHCHQYDLVNLLELFKT